MFGVFGLLGFVDFGSRLLLIIRIQNYNLEVLLDEFHGVDTSPGGYARARAWIPVTEIRPVSTVFLVRIS